MNKIVNRLLDKIEFESLRRGDCFLYKNELYMKIDDDMDFFLLPSHRPNVVRLKDGMPSVLCDPEKIEKVDIEISTYNKNSQS